MALIRVRDKNGNYIDIPALQGESAYDIAVRNGFVGTESEWLESLKGQDYVLTEEDKHEIAQTAIADITDGDEVKY